MIESSIVLVVVDMQNYYIKKDSSFWRYFDSIQPGCMDYINGRCRTIVIPNIQQLSHSFRARNLPVIYLRLCGRKADRSDLHPFFRETWKQALAGGFADVYPLCDDPMSAVVDDLAPHHGDYVFEKTTFSAFTSTSLHDHLQSIGAKILVFTGLATSQCVETTARDASDRGYEVIQIEDAQADYDEVTHNASLYSSQGVCGGKIVNTEEFFRSFRQG